MIQEQNNSRVLFVDDEASILKAMKRLTIHEGWETFFATSAEEGLEIIKNNDINVVVSDMRMPGMNGADFLVHIKKRFPDTQRLLMTGYSDVNALEKVVNDAGIFNYVSKPWDDKMLVNVIKNAILFQEAETKKRSESEKNRSTSVKLGKLALSLKGRVKEKDIEVQQALSLLEMEHTQTTQRVQSLLSAFSRLINISGKGDNNTKFIMEMSIQIARQFNLDPTQLDNLLMASQLYNIGSLVRSDASSNANIDSQKMYQAEIELSATILSGLSEFSEVSNIINKHKEHLDGSGYPNKLREKDIPLTARIMCVVTEYILLRQGKKTDNIQGHQQAKNYMLQRAGKFYDAEVVEIFFNLVNEHTPVQDSTILSSRNSDLLPGMVLAEDLLSQHGALLLSAGTVLEESHIQQLFSFEQSTGIGLIVHVKVNEGQIHDERRSIHCTQ